MLAAAHDYSTCMSIHLLSHGNQKHVLFIHQLRHIFAKQLRTLIKTLGFAQDIIG